MTAKFSSAKSTIRHHNGNLALPFDQRIAVNITDPESLYAALQERGYLWDSAIKRWEYQEKEIPMSIKTIEIDPPADYVSPTPSGGHSLLIPVDLIDPNPHQPRQDFDPEALGELAASIAQHGLIQPITVEPVFPPLGEVEEVRYILHAGERRLRAAKLAGLAEIPAYIVEPGADAGQLLIRAVVENIQRENLNPIELARAYQQLADQGLSDAKIAGAVGKSRSAVANARRLLHLPDERQQQLAGGDLSERQALALVPLYQLPQAAQKKIVGEYHGKQLVNNPEKLTSNEIRENLKRAVRSISQAFDLFQPDESFPVDTPGIVQPACPGCPNYIETGPSCLGLDCYKAKNAAWKMIRLEDAARLTGIDFLDPAVDLPWDAYSQFYDYTDNALLQHAKTTNCPNLRLRCNNFTRADPVADGVDHHISLICYHPGKGQKCACEQALKAGEIAAQKARELKFGQMKQQVANLLADAIRQLQPGGLKAIVRYVASRKLKSDDPGYLIQQIANSLADKNVYWYNGTTESEFRTRIDEYLAEIGLTLPSTEPVEGDGLGMGSSTADIEAARSSYINGLYPNTDPSAASPETQLAAIAAALESPDLKYNQLTAYKNQLQEIFALLDVDGSYDRPTQLALITAWEEISDQVEQRRRNFSYKPLNL
jgi:ParB/RepB/Spo0J family partition protein